MNSLAILLLTTTLLSEQAAGEDLQSRERAARKACLAGEPRQGVEILADLYIDTKELAYIFNQGRCFEQNAMYFEAIGRFREYLFKGEDRLSVEEKAQTQKHIDACEVYLSSDDVRRREAIPASDANVVQPTPAAVAVTEPQADGPRSASRLRVASIVLGSVGVVALSTGLVLNLKVNSMAKDLEKPANYDRDTESSRKDYKTIGWISYGTGVACLAGAAVLYYLDWRSSRGQPAVALLPTLGLDNAGAVLKGAF